MIDQTTERGVRAGSGERSVEHFGRRNKLSNRSVISTALRASGTISLLLLVAVLFWNRHATWSYWLATLTNQVPASGERDGPATLAQVGPRLSQRGGFDLSGLTIPPGEIHAGGPPKDGIPALSNPRMVDADGAGHLRPQDRVIGVVVGEEARAYPLNVLNYHEIVNDRVGELPLAITYCPLCDSAAAFDRRTPVGEREFGVSGLLYNSNVLMYDRGGRSESLWSQIKTEGISGPAASKFLKPLPLELTTWQDWSFRYPQTKVLSRDTGHPRDYTRNPYASYFERPQLMFPARPTSDRLPAKARVLGVWTQGAARAYPESAFGAARRRVEDQIAGKMLVIEYNPQARSLRVASADGGVYWLYSFWFAWYAFHPETDVLTPSDS